MLLRHDQNMTPRFRSLACKRGIVGTLPLLFLLLTILSDRA